MPGGRQVEHCWRVACGRAAAPGNIAAACVVWVIVGRGVLQHIDMAGAVAWGWDFARGRRREQGEQWRQGKSAWQASSA